MKLESRGALRRRLAPVGAVAALALGLVAAPATAQSSPTAHTVEVYTTLAPRSFVVPGSVLGITVLAPKPFFFDAGIGMWPGTFFLLDPHGWLPPRTTVAKPGATYPTTWSVPWTYGAEVYAFAGWAGLSGHLWTYKLEVDGRFGGGYVQNLGAGGRPGQLHGDLVGFADLEVGYEVTRGLGVGLRLRLGAELVLDTGRTAPLFEDCVVVWW